MRETARQFVLSLFLILLIDAGYAAAGEVTITARQLPAGSWIAAAGTTTPALRYVSFVATGGNATVKLVPLTCIGRLSGNIATVTPPGETTLTDGLTTVVTLTATGLTQPDTYDALLSLRTATNPPREIAPIKIEIYAVPYGIASPAPQLFARVSQHLGSGWLTSALFHPESQRRQARLIVDYGAAGPMPVRTWGAYASGTTSRRVLTTAELLTAKPMGDRGMLVIPLHFDLDDLDPDKYVGRVLLSAGAPNERPLAVPFELAVRAAPTVAVLLVLLGILLGFFAAYVEREGKQRAAMLKRLDQAAGSAQQRNAIVDHIAKGEFAKGEVALQQLEGGAVAPRVRDRVASAISGVPVDPHRWVAEGSPLLYILARALVVLLLAYAGIAAVYLGNDTFGAAGVSDYIGLIIWGLGADVTSKTLSNITPLLPRR